MRLDSVRGLKQELLGAVIRPLATSMRARELSVAAMSLDDMPNIPRTVALGIAMGTRQGDFRLAVRVQRPQDIALEVERLTRKARGEVDIRYVGRIAKRKKRRRATGAKCP